MSIPLVKQESREAGQMLEWSWDDESQIKGKLRCAKMEREPVHIYKATDNTQIGQMGKGTRETQFHEVVETLLRRGKVKFWKGRRRTG